MQMATKKKRKSTASPAKKSAAAKKAARTRKVKADKLWNKTYGPEVSAPPKAEPETVYDYAIQTGRR